MAAQKCRVVRRSNIGNVVTSGAGNVSAIGSFSSGFFDPRPAVLGGVLGDIATYFNEWRILKMKFSYVSMLRVAAASTTAIVPGIWNFGIFDDPGDSTGSLTSGQVVGARTRIERPLDRSWDLTYTPMDPSKWYFVSQQAETTIAAQRLVSPCTVSWATVLSSAFVSSTIGHFFVEYDVEMRGGSIFDTPTLVRGVGERFESKLEGKEETKKVYDAGFAESLDSVVDDAAELETLRKYKKVFLAGGSQLGSGLSLVSAGSGPKGQPGRIGSSKGGAGAGSQLA